MAERQRLERETQRAQHFALLGRLAAGVSHEIRNPLAALFLHVDLEEELQQPTLESAAQVTQVLAEIRMNLARLEDLVQDYLTLVRTSQLERTPQDLGAALHAWAAEWQQLATSQGVLLRLEELEDLGTVALHASTLRRAMLNLVQNALDAMPQRNAHAGRPAHDHTCPAPGPGYRAWHPDRATREDFRALYTTKPGGSGLGLYIVQEIVAAHGGTLAVESALGCGTTFTMTLATADA